MKDSHLIQTKKILSVIIHKLAKNQKSRLISGDNVKSFNSEALLILDSVFQFWNVDGIIRLTGLPKILDDDLYEARGFPSPCWVIFEAGFQLMISLNLDTLAWLLNQTKDLSSTVLLIVIRLHWDIVRNEILQRFKSLGFGKRFIDYIEKDDFPQVQSLLNMAGSQIKKWLKSEKIEIPYQTRLLLRSLRPNFKISLLPETEEKVSSEDYQADILLGIQEYYQKLKEAIESKQWEIIPYSLMKELRPINYPPWDQEALEIMKSDIEGARKIYLPILNGEMEEASLKAYDVFRTHSRRFLKDAASHWNESLYEKDSEDGFPKIEILREKKQSDSFLVDQTLKDLLNQNVFRDEIDRIIAKNYGKSDQEIADVIFKFTGRSITKQAVQKRRIDRVESLIKRPLELKKVITEDQERFEEKKLLIDDEEDD